MALKSIRTQNFASGKNLNTRSIINFLGPVQVEALIVAGGGGGTGGGGGAGGLLYYGTETSKTPNGSILNLPRGESITITIGSGGAGQSQFSSNGTNSSVVFSSASYTARNGGGTYFVGYEGGSGGGAERGTPASFGIGTPGQGNNGSQGAGTASGGGGGAGGAATDANGGTNTGGNGGAGLNYSISGSTVGYAGGGGGGGSGAGGSASHGGGAGAVGPATAGTANRGGGGGGIYTSGGANGGSGIVILRYTDSMANASSTTGSPTLTISGGYRIYTFTGSGSITF